MKKRGIAVIILGIVSLGFTSSLIKWEKLMSGSALYNIMSIALDPNNESNIYIANDKGVFVANVENSMQNLLHSFNGADTHIFRIDLSKEKEGQILIGTNQGLYESKNKGMNWSRVYFDSNEKNRMCFDVINTKEYQYIGTGAGLLMRSLANKNWEKVNGVKDGQSIRRLAILEDNLIIATGNRAYKYNLIKRDLNEIFAVKKVSNMEGEFVDPFLANIKDLVLSENTKTIYIATKEGVYFSEDLGSTWNMLNMSGFPKGSINSIQMFDSKTLLAATSKGAYLYSNDEWKQVYAGLESNDVRQLAINSDGRVFAATNGGVFHFSIRNKEVPLREAEMEKVKSQFTYELIEKEFENDPKINLVHQWAIEYAEVSNEKIKNWRKLARRRAFMPSISVGLDRAASDLFHWNTGANPDELQKGREYTDWDVTVSWDLADLVWSTDQTTIDSRSKLMVELREDVLDEITRLYYERRRLQIEVLRAENSTEPIIITQKMRIEELTALIDSLTGGKFSEYYEDYYKYN